MMNLWWPVVAYLRSPATGLKREFKAHHEDTKTSRRLVPASAFRSLATNIAHPFRFAFLRGLVFFVVLALELSDLPFPEQWLIRLPSSHELAAFGPAAIPFHPLS